MRTDLPESLIVCVATYICLLRLASTMSNITLLLIQLVWLILPQSLSGVIMPYNAPNVCRLLHRSNSFLHICARQRWSSGYIHVWTQTITMFYIGLYRQYSCSVTQIFVLYCRPPTGKSKTKACNWGDPGRLKLWEYCTTLRSVWQVGHSMHKR